MDHFEVFSSLLSMFNCSVEFFWVYSCYKIFFTSPFRTCTPHVSQKVSLNIETYQITPFEIPTNVAVTCTQIVLRAMNGLQPTCSTFSSRRFKCSWFCVVEVEDALLAIWGYSKIQSVQQHDIMEYVFNSQLSFAKLTDWAWDRDQKTCELTTMLSWVLWLRRNKIQPILCCSEFQLYPKIAYFNL